MKIETISGVKGAIKIKSETDGPRVVMFGGTHGDEMSGVKAVEKLQSDFDTDALSLLKGSLVLVHANEEAIMQKKRYLKYNLNRMYKDSYPSDIDTDAYEYKRA